MTLEQAKSVQTFCKDYGISVATYYRRSDKMPRSVLIGCQRRILQKDEEEWLSKLSCAKGD